MFCYVFFLNKEMSEAQWEGVSAFGRVSPGLIEGIHGCVFYFVLYKQRRYALPLSGHGAH